MIAVVGDVHARDRDLEAALMFATLQGVEAIYCTGDLVDGPGDVHRVFALLEAFAVRSVLGNHDAWCLAGTNLVLPEATPLSRLLPSEVGALAALPRTLDLAPGALLCHGLGENFLARLGQDEEGYALENNREVHALVRQRWNLVVNGHSHRPLARTLGNTFFLGAGALGTDRGLVLVDPISLEWTGWSVRQGRVEPEGPSD